MVNYFNVLSHDDEDEENGLLDDNNTTTKNNTTTPPNTSGSSEGIIIPSGYISTKEKLNFQQQQNFEIQFDFNEHNQESTLSTWVLWIDTKKEKSQQPLPDENSEYLQNIQKLGSFNTLKEFKALWDTVNSPFDTNANISIFKEGIEPAWEDVNNKDGGKYSVNYARDGHGDFSRVLNAWFTLISSIVYSSWEHYNQTNGVVLSVRSWGASINLWNDDSNDLEQVQALKDSFQNILKVKFCKFSSHKQSISKSSKDDSNGNSASNGSGVAIKKKKIFNMNLNQLNMMNGYLNKNDNSNSNGNNINTTNGNNWTISGAIKKKKEISNSDESNLIKKESLLSVRSSNQSHLPIQLSPNTLSTSNESSPTTPPQPTTPVPEIPTGVNAWSTGILLGKSPEPEQSKQSQEELEPLDINDNNNSNNNNNNNNNDDSNEKQSQQQSIKQKSPEVPSGINAWSTGILLPKPITIEQPEPIKEEPQQEPVWNNKLVSKSKKESNIPRNSSKDNLQSNQQVESLWEEPQQQQHSKPIKEKKEKKEIKPISTKEDKVKEEKKDKYSNIKTVKEEKKDKYSKVSSYHQPQKQQAPVSIWSNPQNNIVQLISTQPEQPIVEHIEKLEQTTIVPQEPVEQVIKLEIKESKKTIEPVVVSKEVAVKKDNEWTSVEEKKPKKPKKETTSTEEKPEKSTIKSTNEPKDKILFRNLLVEEPTAYPSPVKLPKKESTTTNTTIPATSSTVSQVNKNKSKDTKDKDSKKPKDSKEKELKKLSTSTKLPVTTTKPASHKVQAQAQQTISPNLIMALVAFLVFLIFIYFALF